MKFFREQSREIPVVYEGDVIVAGGGPAGMIAAVAAKRGGAEKVLLVEKNGCIGGMLTSGGVMNLRQFSDGSGDLAIKGLPYEFAHRVWEMGGAMHEPYDREDGFYPEKSLHFRCETEISKYVAQELCLESGVELLLHTNVVGAVKKENTLKGIIVENKSGRQVLMASAIIDCTGDGDVIEYSGSEFLKDGKDVIQPMTLTFVLGNAAVGYWPEPLTKELWAHHRELYARGEYPVKNSGLGLFAGFNENEVYFNATQCPGDATDAWDLTKAEIECRRQAFAITEYFRKNMKGYENAYIKKTGNQIGLRETRRLCGEYTLTEADIEAYTQFPDGIIQNNYMFDMHSPKETTEHTPLEKGSCYSVPYRCLIPEKTDGLIVAGRCISATRRALASHRVMVSAMALGQAAGAAAAIAVKNGIKLRQVNPEELRALLKKQDAIV